MTFYPLIHLCFFLLAR